MSFANSTLFPITTGVSDDRLTLGGCSADELAAEFGTPLYVFDEATLRQVCREFVGEFGSRYADSQVLYASKAFINPALARLVSEEGLGLDVVSGGELAVAQAAAIPPEDIYFHGNNKGAGRAGDGPGLRRRPDRGGQLQRDGAARRPGPVPRCRAGRHAAALARRRTLTLTSTRLPAPWTASSASPSRRGTPRRRCAAP